MYVYAVVNSWAHDGSVYENDVLRVFAKEESAQKYFQEQVARDKEDFKAYNWEVIEDTPVCFDFGEEGFYGAEHSCTKIEELELVED